MNPELKTALATYLTALGDDELVLSHRDSEWCGHAPILEEDIAFANIALDEMGHASVWYTLLADVIGEDRESYPDAIVYQRDAAAYRCAPLVELPKGDWAFTMLRQYLFDVAEKMRLDALLTSTYQPLAEAAAKMRAEEIYHLRHTAAWVKRLGLGTEESHRRMQSALDHLWPYALQLFENGAPVLVEAGYVPDLGMLRGQWVQQVSAYLTESGLTVPRDTQLLGVGREQHSEHLAPLLATLQEVTRAYPGVRW